MVGINELMRPGRGKSRLASELDSNLISLRLNGSCCKTVFVAFVLVVHLQKLEIQILDDLLKIMSESKGIIYMS